MAGGAGSREARLGVIGIGGSGPGRLMTRVAGGWNRCVVSVCVALRAGNGQVGARQRKWALGVIERCGTPAAG